MKRKLIYLTAFIGASSLVTSCGDGSDEETSGNDSTEVVVEEAVEGFEDLCTDENNVFLTIQNYDYSMEEMIDYNDNFEVVRTDWTMLNDSTAELKMHNFELGAEATPTDYQIYVKFNAKNGQTIQPGVYAYQDYESDLWCKVNIITPQGTVWFNWVMGMPDQGNVKLNYSNDDQACGEFNLEVNEEDNSTVGHVLLNGSWNAE